MTTATINTRAANFDPRKTVRAEDQNIHLVGGGQNCSGEREGTLISPIHPLDGGGLRWTVPCKATVSTAGDYLGANDVATYEAANDYSGLWEARNAYDLKFELRQVQGNGQFSLPEDASAARRQIRRELEAELTARMGV